MKMFQTRLRELRKDHELTQEALAERLKTTSDSIYSWEKGRSEPSIAMICEICRTFNVSADYLLGMEDDAGAKLFR